MSPFQILSAIKAYPRKIPGNTFFPNWWILALSLSEFGRYSTCAPNGICGPLSDSPNLRSYGVFPSARKSWLWMIPQIIVHTEFPRLPGDLGHFANSNRIPLDQPTIFHPIQTAIIRLTCLLSLFVLLFRQFCWFLIYEVWTSDDSMIMLHWIVKFLWIVRINNFWLLRRLWKLSRTLLRLLWSFALTLIRLYPLRGVTLPL